MGAVNDKQKSMRLQPLTSVSETMTEITTRFPETFVLPVIRPQLHAERLGGLAVIDTIGRN
jgi:hypothetical protein